MRNKAESSTNSKLQIALVQHSYKGSRAATIAHTESAIESVAKNGAKLVLLSELHTSEYFCQIESVDYFAYAREFEAEVERFSKIAKKNNVVLVASLFEERTRGLYHNTAVVFESDGSVTGKYRKMHIPDDPGFYEKFYFTPGDNEFKPINTSVGKLGILICWDQWYPEASRLMALNGAEILIFPTAIGFDLDDNLDEKNRQLNAWITIQRSHAIANGIFVASINRCGVEKCENKEKSAIDFWGNSFVAGPQGEILTQTSGFGDASVKNSDEILQCEIDFERISQVRNIWPFLRDRRIEFYGDITKRFGS